MMDSIFMRGVMVTAQKNVRIYYTKAPVLIFGLLFPIFMFFAFYMGRSIEISVFFPGFCAMALFFASSSVGPLITPWEKQAGTYERLLSFPVSINVIVLGDMLSGAIYGVLISMAVLAVSLIALGLSFNPLILMISVVLGSLCFASLGVLLSSPSVRSPANIMMFSSMIRFPLIFISGIFIPLAEMDGIGRAFSYLSPLSYLVDLFNAGLSRGTEFPLLLDIIVLAGFTSAFLLIASRFHRRNLMKGL